MFRYFLVVIFLTFSLRTHAKKCALSNYEKATNFEVKCSLEHKDESIQLIYGKKACEFPAGNKVDCAYVMTCSNDGQVRRSGVVFRNGASFNDFCLTSKEVKGKKVRELVQSKSQIGSAFLQCPVTEELNIEFKIGEKFQDCKFSF